MPPATKSSVSATSSTRDSGGRAARLDVRLTAEHKRLIEQAATLLGQSLSDYHGVASGRAGAGDGAGRDVDPAVGA